SPRWTVPAVIRPVGGSSPSTDSMVTVLPEPDSPTTPSTRPGATSKLTRSTTRLAGPPGCGRNSTVRSRTDSTGGSLAVGRGAVASRPPPGGSVIVAAADLGAEAGVRVEQDVHVGGVDQHPVAARDPLPGVRRGVAHGGH